MDERSINDKSEFKFIHHIPFSFQIICERRSNPSNFVSLITALFHWDVYISTFAQHTHFIFPMTVGSLSVQHWKHSAKITDEKN